MPSKNRVKEYAPDSYYHIYNRGVNKRRIYLDDEDYRVFLNLFKRYLSNSPQKDNKGREYPWLQNELQLLVYCLMPNHFHMLIFQKDMEAMTKLMRGVCTSYTAYFNKKHQRTGPLFQDVFKASRIAQDNYLLHISRYIHLNPRRYKEWKYSSLENYLGTPPPEWLQVESMLDLFESPSSYKAFLADYEDYKNTLDELKTELADLSKDGPWKGGLGG